jgi:Meckel syndrome type 1 protein
MTVPPTADDDNPFQRPSAWPRMPQAPFRIGPLPKAARSAPPATPAPFPIRPIAAPQPRGGLGGGASPAFFGSGPMSGVARPSAPPVPQPTGAPPEPAAAAVPEPELQAPAEPPPMQVAPVVVVARERSTPPEDDGLEPADFAFAPRAAPRGSRAPLIVAGGLAVLGAGALAMLLGTRGGPAPAPAVTPAASLPAAAPPLVPAPPAPAPTLASAPEPSAAAAPAPPPPPARPATPRPARLASAARRALVQAAPAASDAPPEAGPAPAASAPAAAPEPPAQATVLPPAAALQPAPKPPVDPAAPISTKPHYSE